MIDLPCVIFAGGRSSRMGEDKALLPFGKFSTLTEFQLDKLQKIFQNVYVSCKNKDKFNFTANFIEDTPTDNLYAPTAGFIAIFEKLQCEKIFVISVDTPFISEHEIDGLMHNDNNCLDATVAMLKDKVQPMCGIYHESLYKHFTHMLETDNHKLGFLLKNSNTKYINFHNEKAFLNLNNLLQYKEALALI